MTEPHDADPCARCGEPFGSAIHDPNDERGYGADAHDFEPSTPVDLAAETPLVTEPHAGCTEANCDHPGADHPATPATREWNACVEVRVIATQAASPADMQTGEDDDYCMASTRRDGVWNEKGADDPPLCCWRPDAHTGDHHDPFHRLDWRWEPSTPEPAPTPQEASA